MALKWYGDRCRDVIRQHLGDNLEYASDALAEQVNVKVATPGPPRSLPGEAPHIDHHELEGSYTADTDKQALASRIGSDVPHAVYTELGTDRMAPRPHFRVTIFAFLQDFARLLVR